MSAWCPPMETPRARQIQTWRPPTGRWHRQAAAQSGLPVESRPGPTTAQRNPAPTAITPKYPGRHGQTPAHAVHPPPAHQSPHILTYTEHPAKQNLAAEREAQRRIYVLIPFSAPGSRMVQVGVTILQARSYGLSEWHSRMSHFLSLCSD